MFPKHSFQFLATYIYIWMLLSGLITLRCQHNRCKGYYLMDTGNMKTKLYPVAVSENTVPVRSHEYCAVLCTNAKNCDAHRKESENNCDIYTTYPSSMETSVPHNVLLFMKLPDCDDGFHNLFEQQCYHVVKRSEDWFGAQDYCYSRQSYLVEFSDIDEHNAIKAYLQGVGATWIWVGGITTPEYSVPGTNQRVYEWATSKDSIPNSYSGWSNRFVPAELSKACLMLYSSSNYDLSDENCAGNKTWLVCER